ncbi:hypothetical protein BC828DRAFT_128094 [Blastocladiella britannica]|nr:hypothetical protein BC828DRAFT_128094 [Blastocladiella britannica]
MIGCITRPMHTGHRRDVRNSLTSTTGNTSASARRRPILIVDRPARNPCLLDQSPSISAIGLGFSRGPCTGGSPGGWTGPSPRPNRSLMWCRNWRSTQSRQGASDSGGNNGWWSRKSAAAGRALVGAAAGSRKKPQGNSCTLSRTSQVHRSPRSPHHWIRQRPRHPCV